MIIAEEAAVSEVFDSVVQQMSAFFCEDYVILSPTQTEWLHWKFDILLGIFEKVGMKKNMKNMVNTVCRPCHITDRNSDTAHTQQMTGEVPSYWKQYQ